MLMMPERGLVSWGRMPGEGRLHDSRKLVEGLGLRSKGKP